MCIKRLFLPRKGVHSVTLDPFFSSLESLFLSLFVRKIGNAIAKKEEENRKLSNSNNNNNTKSHFLLLLQVSICSFLTFSLVLLSGFFFFCYVFLASQTRKKQSIEVVFQPRVYIIYTKPQFIILVTICRILLLCFSDCKFSKQKKKNLSFSLSLSLHGIIIQKMVSFS